MGKRIISFLLTLIVLAGIMPVNDVYAAGNISISTADSYSNGSNYYIVDNQEFFSNSDDQDYLYKKDMDSETSQLILAEHVISMVGSNQSIYLIVYRDENSSALLHYNIGSDTVTTLKTFAILITNMAMRGQQIYYLANNAIMNYDVDTNKETCVVDLVNISYFFFSDYNTLKYYADRGEGTYPTINAFHFDDSTVRVDGIQTISHDTFSLSTNAITYSPRLTAPTTDNPYYTTLNPFHQSGYGMAPNIGNCTCYAYGRSYENLDEKPSLSLGNAGVWYDYNKTNGYYSYGSTPALGAVAVWKSSGAGHVAVVEVIDGDTVVTSESGWNSFYFKTVTRSASNANFNESSYYSFQGFIYVLGQNTTSLRTYTINYNANGGSLPTASLSHELTGINTDRGSQALVVYDGSGSLVNTNQYGVEVAVDVNGKVTSQRLYGSTDQLTVPTGGFVLSGQGGTGSFVEEISVGDYVGYDTDEMMVYVYHSKSDYDANHKRVLSGEAIGTLPVPTRTGYEFIGWYSGGAYVSASTIVSKNMTLVAMWQEDPRITPSATSFDFTLGGTDDGATLYLTFSEYNGTVHYSISKSNSGIVGHQWGEWDQNNTYSVYIYALAEGTTTLTFSLNDSETGEVLDTVTVNITVRKNNCTLTYDAPGALYIPESETVASGSTITVKGVMKFGYTFRGWGTYAGDTSVDYRPGDTITCTSDITLYAIWEEPTEIYASETLSDASVYIGCSNGVFCTFTPKVSTSYLFISIEEAHLNPYIEIYNGDMECLGQSGGGYQDFAAEVVLNAGETYYIYVYGEESSTIGFFIDRGYEIAYDANGGTGVPSKTYSYCAEDGTVSTAMPSREGYTFLGWATSPNATAAEYAAGEDIDVSKDTTLYAVWSSSAPPEETDPTTPPEESKPTTPPAENEPTTPPVDDAPVNPPAVKENPFVDVPGDAFYHDPVLWAVENVITNGVDATHFGPEVGCTRAHVVTFLWRAAGSPKTSSGYNPFADVIPGAYYYDAVLWAVEKGITNGTSATTFEPDVTCTRGQIVTFLWRYQDSPAVAQSSNFADVPANQYYSTAVAWAVENGITNGMGDGIFAPDATCTRGQIVTFLYRAMA